MAVWMVGLLWHSWMPSSRVPSHSSLIAAMAGFAKFMASTCGVCQAGPAPGSSPRCAITPPSWQRAISSSWCAFFVSQAPQKHARSAPPRWTGELLTKGGRHDAKGWSRFTRLRRGLHVEFGGAGEHRHAERLVDDRPRRHVGEVSRRRLRRLDLCRLPRLHLGRRDLVGAERLRRVRLDAL